VTEKGGALSLESLGQVQDESFPGVSESADFAWYAVQTRPRHEKKVNSSLGEKGIQSFLPLHRQRQRWSDRYQWVETPLFSQYVFVRVPTSSEWRVRVLRTTGVVQFVGAPGRGTSIPEEQIESLQTIIAQRIPVRLHEFLRVGERVRICGGALEGIEGILSEVKNDRSFVISVDLIQKSLAIRIEGFEVEPI
jgi:transcription antitermination factor NusG